MSSILFAKHVSFEHSVSSPRPVITSRREKKTTKRPKFFSTQSTVIPLHAPSSAGTCCLHVLSELGRGAASFLATESTGTVLIPRLMTRIAGHAIFLEEVSLPQKLDRMSDERTANKSLARVGTAVRAAAVFVAMLVKVFFSRSLVLLRGRANGYCATNNPSSDMTL